jgi:hypothetical protein
MPRPSLLLPIQPQVLRSASGFSLGPFRLVLSAYTSPVADQRSVIKCAMRKSPNLESESLTFAPVTLSLPGTGPPALDVTLFTCCANPACDPSPCQKLNFQPQLPGAPSVLKSSAPSPFDPRCDVLHLAALLPQMPCQYQPADSHWAPLRFPTAVPLETLICFSYLHLRRRVVGFWAASLLTFTISSIISGRCSPLQDLYILATIRPQKTRCVRSSNGYPSAWD